MIDFEIISQSIGAGLFLILTALLLPNWQGRLLSTLLILASAITAVWLGSLAYYAAWGTIPLLVPRMLEVIRDAAWLAFLVAIISRNLGRARLGRLSMLFLAPAAIVCFVLVDLLETGGRGFGKAPRVAVDLDRLLVGHLLLSILGLVLIEHLYRNTTPERRWAIKFLCLGVGGLFAYDFYLYSDAVLFKAISPNIWAARGMVNGLAVPLIALAAARNRQWKLDLFVSRRVVFHSTAILAIGSYLLAMAGVGYYIRVYGGTWGQSLQIVFLAGAIMVLLLLIFSGQARSQLRVFLAKSFYRNKYEYREEWLKFTAMLSQDVAGAHVRANIVRAIANIMECPRGALWERDESGVFNAVEDWNMGVPEGAAEPSNSSLTRFMEDTGWVINLKEYRHKPEVYNRLALPAWVEMLESPWLIVPLMLRDELLGFVVLSRSRATMSFNWEDSDLLKTVGRQTAAYLALLQATGALTRARQFEAFNRLSAFVVHDLKNIAGQLTLVASNARRHMGNPEFTEDAVATVENAVSKMNRMLQHLRKGRPTEALTEAVDLHEVLEEAVNNRSATRPVPILESNATGLKTLAGRDRLTAVMEHVVQNAQEATPANGAVRLRLYRDCDSAVIEIEDTGCGMDSEFVRDRLFAPFDTTKGNAGMGIGVFESREVVRTLGGEMKVESSLGKGTTFTIVLPLQPAQEGAQSGQEHVNGSIGAVQ